MNRPALQIKQVGVSRMASRARKVFGTFEKRAPGLDFGLNAICGVEFAVKLSSDKSKIYRTDKC